MTRALRVLRPSLPSPMRAASIVDEPTGVQPLPQVGGRPASLAAATNTAIARAGVTEEEPIQARRIARTAAGARIARKENNSGLPDNLKSGIEALSGLSMDNVKVHYNSPQPAQLNALAYAQGSDIHLAPNAEAQLQTIPHEAWHVVQQKQGRVVASTSL